MKKENVITQVMQPDKAQFIIELKKGKNKYTVLCSFNAKSQNTVVEGIIKTCDYCPTPLEKLRRQLNNKKVSVKEKLFVYQQMEAETFLYFEA